MNKKKGLAVKFGPYGYILPSLSVFAIFLFYPFFKTIYLSLFMTNKMGQAKLFVGLQNYIDLLTSEEFQNSILVTVIFVAIVVVLGMFLGLVGAVLCNKSFPGIRIFSTAYALPMAIASSSAAMIFKIILDPTIGILDKLLHLNINWINDPKYAGIDEVIYERARVDGVSPIRQFFSLTLPGLSPIMFYTIVVNIIQAFQSFGQVKILTQGGPGDATNLIVYSIYRDAFFNFRFGTAAAESVILFLIILVLTLLMFRSEKNVNYG